jgi:membrane-associated HD superfamily phosphohydrolase
MKKLNVGQFDECNITISELTTIEKSIAWIVQSMFHQRIEYPKVVQEKAKSEPLPVIASREGT